MNKVLLIDKGLEFMARYAAPSLSTGNFAAGIVGSDLDAVRSAFTYPGTIRVRDMDGLVPDYVYTGFTEIKSIRTTGGDIAVTVYREGNHAE
jgi:hypothetical protein